MTQVTGVSATDAHLALSEEHTAPNYHPLPVVIAEGLGVWVTDVEGRRYLDALSGYSALNFGHRHPRLVAAAERQLHRITLTSRAFHNDQLAPFCAELAELAGSDLVLPMNTGAEAVETAVKVARRWGHDVKGIPADTAEVVVAAGNFHGRTITISSFSTDPTTRARFGPYTPGFAPVPYGDADAVAAAVTERTAAVLVEPIQGEGGVIIPPRGYLSALRQICDDRGILLAVDEIQSGLGRTGRTFAYEHDGARPDLLILGKALGGGIMPLSAVVGARDVIGVIRPGEHGSTFGGNPLACAIGREVIALLTGGELQRQADVLGRQLTEGLLAMHDRGVTEVRSVGLWAGVDIDPALGTGRQVCERLMAHGVLAKDTHGSTVRLAPPLVITSEELDWLLGRFGEALDDLRG